MAHKHSAKVLYFVLKDKEQERMNLMKKIYVLDKLHLGMNFSAVDCEFFLMNQKYVFNKVPLNRNIHKTRSIHKPCVACSYVEHDSAIKKNELEIHPLIWMNFKCIMLSKRSRTQRLDMTDSIFMIFLQRPNSKDIK